MKDQRKTEIKVGITVLTAILIFIAILGWAKNISLNANRKIIIVKFENVSGLEIGDNVTINGVRKGFVDNIIIKSSSVYVRLSLESDVYLKSDAKFTVTMLDLMGGKKVEIYPGINNSPFDYDKVYSGSYSADIPAVMTMVGTISDDLPKLMNEVNTSLTSLNDYLADRTLEANIKTAISNLVEVSYKLNSIIDENRVNLKKLASNSVDLTNDAKEFIKENKENINQTLSDVSELIKKSDQLMAKLNNLVDETNAKKNNAGKILYDENLINDLKETLTTVKSLTKTILEQIQSDGLKVKADVDLF